jgi:hypothetical protein
VRTVWAALGDWGVQAALKAVWVALEVRDGQAVRVVWVALEAWAEQAGQVEPT